MKNFNGSGSSSIIGQIPDDCKFTKAKDFIAEYPKGLLQIKGILKTHSEKYNRDNYSLYIVRNGNCPNMDEKYMLMNVPGWYGKKLMDHFQEEGKTAEEYFANCSLKSISKWTTDFGTDSISIEAYVE